MGLLGVIQVLPLVEVFFVEVLGSLLKFSLSFLTFRLLLLLNFMELYMLWKILKSWVLLMSSSNVTLSWFVLCLLLGQMFFGCFVIDDCLSYCGKIRFMVTHIFRKGNACSWLI